MTKLTLGTHPYLLGFEQLERLVERSAKTGNDDTRPIISNKPVTHLTALRLRWRDLAMTI